MNGQVGISASNFRIGWLRVDASMVRSEGDSLSPALLVPCSIQLDGREEGGAIAITELEAELVIPTAAGVGLGPRIGMPARVSGMETQGGMWVSIPSGPIEHNIVFRFPLSREQVRLLEGYAERLTEQEVPIGLRTHAALAWVRQSENVRRPGAATHPVASTLGLASELWSLEPARIEPLELRLRREDWASQVLPGLGGNAVRMIAVRLPDATRALGAEAVAALDAARERYDAGDFRGAIQRCRDLRDAVGDHLGAGEKTIAACVGERLDWSADSPGRALLDNLWKTLSDLSSAAHHRDGKGFRGAEARATILIAAAAIEYLTELLEPEV